MPNVGKDGKYDCSFLDSNGKEIGLMLTKDKNGKPSYNELYDDALSQQYFAESPGYAHLKPQLEIPAVQWDFSHGFGQEYMENASKYYTATNVDGRFKNMIISGPLPVAIALPTTYPATSPDVTNGGFEIGGYGNPPTGWTVDAGTAVLGTAFAGAHSGDYAVTISPSGSDVIIHQDVAWDDSYQNVPVTAEVWFQCAGAAGTTLGKITIDDGVGTTSASQTSFSASIWYKTSVTRTLDANATRLRITITGDYVASNVACYADDCKVYMAHVAPPVKAVDFNDGLYFAMGSCIFKLNSAGDGFTFVANVYRPITDISVLTNFVANIDQPTLVICCGGTEAPYQYMNIGGAMTESTLSTGYAEFMSRVGDVPYKVVQPNEIKTAVSNNFMNTGSWTDAIPVGDSSNDITAPVLDLNGTPIIFKEDMPYYLDGSGEVQRLAPELISEKSSTSGKNAVVWQGCAYIPAGTQALYEYDGSTEALTDISPSKYITNSTDFDGQIVALAHDAQYLFAVIDNGTKIEVVAGRWESFEDEGTSWVWHPLSEITLAGCVYATTSTVYARRLWLLSTSTTDAVYYIPIPQQYGSITSDASYSFTSGGNIITSWHHLNFRSDKKAWVKITLTMSGTTTNVYWRAYYQKLGDSSWTEINSAAKFKTSPTTTAYLPVDGSSNKPSSPMMRFKFEPVTNSSSNTPVLLHYDVRAIWYPAVKKIIQCQIRIDDNIRDKQGNIDDTQTAATIRTALDELANPTICWPRTFYPPYWLSATDTKYVKLLPPQIVAVADERSSNNIIWAYNLAMMIADGVSF